MSARDLRMLQLAYIGTACQAHGEAVLDALLAQSRRNNLAGGVGGSGDAADLRAVIEAPVAPLEDPNLAAQFRGFAELLARAA